jgi:hypothetical protein
MLGKFTIDIEVVGTCNLRCRSGAVGNRFLDAAMQARPDEFVVSLSGFEQAQYGVSHAGGDIERVKANMRWLAELVALNGHRTDVSDCYTHNGQPDAAAMAELCEALRFTFLPGITDSMPVEKVLRAVGGDVPPEDADIIAKMLVPLPDQIAIAAANADHEGGCDLLDSRLDIDADGAVKLCCSSYDRASNAATVILSLPFEELPARRRRGATIPRDSLLYHFLSGALLRNRDHDAPPVHAVFVDLAALADALQSDPGYRDSVVAMRGVIEQWRALPC